MGVGANGQSATNVMGDPPIGYRQWVREPLNPTGRTFQSKLLSHPRAFRSLRNKRAP